MGHKKKSEEPFEFPNSVLNQIEECSAGGYVLFVFDTEGKPVVYSYFDNTPNAMAMNFYIDNWTKALAKINLDITIESIHKDVDEENL